MTEFKAEDRVRYQGDKGTVVKFIPAQGNFMAVCVVDFDKGVRGTVRATDVRVEES
ncbi:MULTISPECIES: hypothetical protein [unclassified Streptomyces]|uniref:KOW domain-containing protein n=1 Tax=Streptomyces sp. NBC_00180 TaxID=2903632 RepID=A0AAU1IAE0_9ACTN|nr:hypothetical protein OG331_01325 [Streptomyces sp. NBC_01017]WSV35198.1 hypothetical protein OG331_50650 [Streptomyces sp. NBC_01017]